MPSSVDFNRRPGGRAEATAGAPGPGDGAGRFGKLNTKNGVIYQVGQWYPRMCVYDDAEGWNTLPYMGLGEFYCDYGNYDYYITAPSAIIVYGSGDLQNAPEVLTAEEITDRRISFIKHLYEIQRGYNLSESANPIDYGGADDNTCVSGSFNKLIGALSDAGHQGVQIIFVTSALIHMQVPFLTKQAFGALSEENRTRFAQSWENENFSAFSFFSIL